MRWYIDSSAILKLIKPENESRELKSSLSGLLTTSLLARVEVIRTINNYFPELLEGAHDVLADISMIPLDYSTITTAENLPSFIKLRASDSIYIASALVLKSELDGIITYDKEMIKAAESLGFKTMSPGMK